MASTPIDHLASDRIYKYAHQTLEDPSGLTLNILTPAMTVHVCMPKCLDTCLNSSQMSRYPSGHLRDICIPIQTLFPFPDSCPDTCLDNSSDI